MSLVADGHLGGFITGGDPDTFDPVVWQDLVNRFKPQNLVDIGCGEGYAVEWFVNNGVDAIGIEGSTKALEKSPVKDRIIIHDFTTGPYTLQPKFDIAWSCEFVEHVEAKYSNNYMSAFCSAPIVAMTYSEPQWSDGGHHHVNCQPQSYWNDKFAARGYQWMEEYSLYLRSIATARWVKPTVSVFRKAYD
jgi:SAM-dependent methyltransferase